MKMETKWKGKQMIIWNKKWAILLIYFVFVFLHTNKDKHENCCYILLLKKFLLELNILKLILGIKYIKCYSWNQIY
jgi:hypothetical protein